MVLKKLNISLAGLFLVLAMLLFDMSAIAQGEKKFIRRGNKAFDRGEFKEAEIDYQKALEKNKKSDVGEFNLGGALFQQENFKESAMLFDNVSRRNLPEQQRAGAFHNLGNSMVQLQQFEQAVEAYKNALRLNPDDLDTKYNLLYAQQMLRQQQEQEKQQDQKQDQQDQDDKQDQKDQQEQAQNQEQDQQQDQQQQDSQQQDSQQDQQQQAQSQPKQISKEDAERMLQAMQERERQTMEKLKLEEFKNAKRVTTEKDW